MKLLALPAFADNYVWMLHNGRDALVVDPGDAAPVLAALDEQALHLAGILVTHHHGDHVGGLAGLLERFPRCVVHAPARERMPVPTQAVSDGEQVELLGLRWEVIEVPGHTAGHVAFFCPAVPTGTEGSDLEQAVLFCGDTLFSGGCGRLFEGSPSQMQASLSRLAALPPHTQVCCAHEYTLANLRFALAVDPDNSALIDHEARCQALRAHGQPTLPALLETELLINPFLRCDSPAVAAAAARRDPSARTPVEVFATIRAWKNDYR